MKEGMVGRTSDDDDDGIARTKQPKESACVYIITLKLPGGTNASRHKQHEAGRNGYKTSHEQNVTFEHLLVLRGSMLKQHLLFFSFLAFRKEGICSMCRLVEVFR